MEQENIKDENYIPKTLGEAHLFLDTYLVDKDVFKNTPEDQVMGIAHMTLGRWLRNRWHLWWSPELYEKVKEAKPDYPAEKPELVQGFNDLGIMVGDDMSGIIIMSYHAKLNDRPYDLDAEVKKIKEFYENQNKEE